MLPNFDNCCVTNIRKLDDYFMNDELFEQLDVIDGCKVSSKDFLENYVKKQRAVKVTGCFRPNRKLVQNVSTFISVGEQRKSWSLLDLGDRKGGSEIDTTSKTILDEFLHKKKARYLASREMDKNLEKSFHISWPDFLPKDLRKKRRSEMLHAGSFHTGPAPRVHPQYLETFSSVLHGRQWVVLFPSDLPGLVLDRYICSRKCSSPISQEDSLSFFQTLVPQISRRLLFNKAFQHTFLDPGDAIYIPARQASTRLNMEDSIWADKSFLSAKGLEVSRNHFKKADVDLKRLSDDDAKRYVELTKQVMALKENNPDKKEDHSQKILEGLYL